MLSFIDEDRIWEFQTRNRFLNEIADKIIEEGKYFEIGCFDLSYTLKNFV
jgi:hypothetical protein